jgi:hypothetical protein
MQLHISLLGLIPQYDPMESLQYPGFLTHQSLQYSEFKPSAVLQYCPKLVVIEGHAVLSPAQYRWQNSELTYIDGWPHNRLKASEVPSLHAWAITGLVGTVA